MKTTQDNITAETLKEFNEKFGLEGLYQEVRDNDWIAKGTDKYTWVAVTDKVKDFIAQALTRQRIALIEQIEPLDLVDNCNPDCTPVEHAYHKGTWDAHIKLEKILTALRKEV